MRSGFSYSVDDQCELSKSLNCWWREAEEFDENGHLKFEFSDLSKLTPRLKLLREMERLVFVASEGLDDLRNKLITYRSGDFWLPVGGLNKEDMDIPPVITILLTGLIGSGKSSFVNMMYSVLGRSGLIPFAQTSGGSSHYTTMFLEEHNVVRSIRGGFCVFDTRGLDHNRMNEGLEEFLTWMNDGVRQYQPCCRAGDQKLGASFALPRSCLITGTRYKKRKVNFAMVVANLAEIHVAFKSGDLKSVDSIRDLFQYPCVQKSNESPILILTHGDVLNAEDRINSRLRICEYIGISETTGAYDIACLTEQGILPDESDPVTAFALTEAVYRSLMLADRSHLPRKRFKDWIILLLSWIMCCIASFFGFLAHFFSKFDNKKLN